MDRLKISDNVMDRLKISDNVMDRLKISDNAATMIMSPFIQACDGNISDFSLSRSTTYRARIANRLQVSKEILKEYSPEFVALHWDGKLIQERYGEKYDALFTIASGPPHFKEGNC